jgi:cation diffusion facilitator CzcD-associated flavoprotein CzcO/NAD(P)-dependent dehydrogenase (short-subunit alcohol dehydrogenase family)
MQKQDYQVVIVGGGFSGMGVAIRLLKEGIEDFVILEKASQLGGTWRDNTYPGCACDVASQLYSFSYAPNPDWSRVFAEQPEIQKYLLDTAERFGLERFVRYDAEVVSARWQADTQRWELETTQGRFGGHVLVSGAGPLHEPLVPALPGLETFEGERFHTARWNHDHELQGARVAVIGTGSSGIQVVPKLQPEVKQLTLFQRTAPWVLPKPDHAIPAVERAAFRSLPGFQRAYRGTIYWLLECLQLAQRRPAVMRQLQKIGLWHLRRQVQDPELRRVLTPDFVLGCKRLLLSNTYYPALQEANVDVVPTGVSRVTPNGVVDANGDEHRFDTLVFATGFQVTDPPIAERVFGRGGVSLAEDWDGSPQAYLGTCVAGFPNLFLMIGPNLGNGHSSAFVQIEAQADYVVDALRTLRRDGLASVEVRRGVQDRYNDEVQEALTDTVWNAGGCSSWYIDAKGRNTSIYPWTTVDMRRRLARFDVNAFVIQQRPDLPPRQRPLRALDPKGSVVAITGGARGIGLAVARAFVSAGATVVLGDLDHGAAQAAAAELGPRAQALALDVASRDSFRRFLSAIELEHGPLDVLVNNAGVMPTGRFLDESDAIGAVAMRVNYEGTALGMKLALPAMIERGRGHVVNVISMASKVPIPGLASYVASKHATLGLTASVRCELRGTGVGISAILPGPVRTRLATGIPLEGLFAVEPERVARAVVKTCKTRAAEVTVPRWHGAIPSWAFTLFRRLFGDEQVLRSTDASARHDYDAELALQSERRVAPNTPAPVGAAR